MNTIIWFACALSVGGTAVWVGLEWLSGEPDGVESGGFNPAVEATEAVLDAFDAPALENADPAVDFKEPDRCSDSGQVRPCGLN
jgi:hypothetical protein